MVFKILPWCELESAVVQEGIYDAWSVRYWNIWMVGSNMLGNPFMCGSVKAYGEVSALGSPENVIEKTVWKINQRKQYVWEVSKENMYA